MNTDTQSHLDQHQQRHWDFAKFLAALSTAFLTIVTASKDLAASSSWALTFVLAGQLLSLFCGVVLLYQMVRAPALLYLSSRWQEVRSRDPNPDLEIALEKNERWCERLHSAQIGLFAVSLIALVVLLVCYEVPSNIQTKETVVDCRLDQEKPESNDEANDVLSPD